MTRVTNIERIARMEQRQEDMAEDIKEIKALIKAQDKKLAEFVTASEKRFLTRLEGRAIMTVFGISVTLLTLWLNIKDKW